MISYSLMESKKLVILSLGGSLIVPRGGIDIKFLQKFDQFIRQKVAQGHRFFIVAGGGSTCRHYQRAVAAISGKKIADEDLDWLGVHATRLNGRLLHMIFQDIAYKHLIKHYDLVDKKAADAKVVIGVGWKPGWSTDHNAVLLAQDYGVDQVINLTRVKMVYDMDPKKYKEAKPIKKLSWDQLIKIVDKEWKPGLQAPFDPVAAQLAKKAGLKVIICDGRNLQNLDNIIKGKEFIGTIIE